MSIRTYSELITLPTFLNRFKYLQLNGQVGKETFGFERYLNQGNPAQRKNNQKDEKGV